MTEHDLLLADIKRLLAHPDGPDDPVSLAQTLTDGYARALTIEAERVRLQKEIGRKTATLSRGDTTTRAAELTALVKKLEAKDGTLKDLRSHLDRLRDRHSVAIRASA
jgi:hypothetical protein